MDISLLLPIIIVLMIVPLFLSSRKQRRQQGEMQKLQASLEPGDVVSTTSGLRGTVVDASYEDTIDLEIADGVVTTWVRAAIRDKITTDAAAHEAEAPVMPDVPAAAPSLDKASLDKAPLDKAPLEQAPLDKAPLEQAPLDGAAEQPARVETWEKDDSTNGSARS